MPDHPVSTTIRILLVEDSKIDTELILRQLKKDGLDVEYKQVITEDEFIAALAWIPDMILSDYFLPQFSGTRALEIIKEKNQDIPFILISGAADEKTIINAFKRGANDYLMKDRLGRLGAAIQHALEQKRLREEKRHANEALRKSEERLELFFAQSLDGFFFMMLDEPVRWDDTVDKEKVLDYVFTHQRVTKINDAMLAQYKSTGEQFIGLTPSELFSHDLKQGRELWRELFNTGHMVSITDQRRFDGTQIWIEGDNVCLYDNDRRIIGHFGIQRDITTRKQAEENLHSQNEYLALLNEMNRAILVSDNYESIMQILAVNLIKIINADDCYILRWNEETKTHIPVITTAKLDFDFKDPSIYPEEISMTAAILRIGRVIAIDDVLNSTYLNPEIIKRFPAKSMIGIPLIAGAQKLGVAIIAFNTLHSFTQEEIKRAEQTGNHVAVALLDLEQHLEIQRRLRESTALTKISRALSETERGGTDQVLQLIVDSARDLIYQADESVIHLVEAENETLISRAISGFEISKKASERPSIGMKEGVSGHVIATGETVNIGDINDNPLYVRKGKFPHYRSLLVAPVQSGGEPIGTISVQSRAPHAFSSSDVKLLNALSIQAAIALENSRLFEATQQSLREANALYRTSQGLASSLDTDELIEDVVNLLQTNFGYYNVQIYLLDPETGDAVLKSGSGETGARMLEARTRLPKGIGIVNHVVETAFPFVSNNVNDIVFFYRNPLLPDTQSEMTVPIKVDGEVVGVIDVQEKPPNKLTDNDLKLMVAVADQLSVALQRASLYTNLQTALQQEQNVRSQLIQSERLALVGRLLASVSHELNNPLQAIHNALFLLKDEEHLSPQGKQDLDVILSESERMASLIERLRSAYRPGRVKDFRPVELNSLIEDVHTLISTFLRQKQIAFEFHPDPDLPPISGMSDQMRQVVLNLFLNAIEVMKPGSRLVARTQSLPRQNEILITVKDTGPGIPPEILPKIFDAFITGKQTGTGLGLTITRDIIEQHFGRIEANNDPEGGAIFSVWLPVSGKEQE